MGVNSLLCSCLLFQTGLCRLYVTGLFEVFGDGDNLEVAVLDELEYLGTLGRLVNVGFDALEGVEYRCTGLIEVTVTFGNVVDTLLGETSVMRHPPLMSTHSPTLEFSWTTTLEERMVLRPISTSPAIETLLPMTTPSCMCESWPT